MRVATIRNLTVGAAALALSACAQDGFSSLSPSERNALIGAGVGAAAGAALADDDAAGALIGGAAGAALGYYTGCREQGGCFVGGRRVADERVYDSRAGRYYYVDQQTGRTYWENGEYRG
jgi:outer membrane protein assembly factor BamB